MTRACTKLKKSVSEIRSRPYNYKDTAQLDLDSLLSYTNGLDLSVRKSLTPPIIIYKHSMFRYVSKSYEIQFCCLYVVP